MNAVLSRVSLAGCRSFEYNSGTRGLLAKTVSIVARIALLALAGLIIANVISPYYLGLGAMGVSVIALGSYLLGSSLRRNVQPLLFEMMVTLACIALSVMAGLGFLSSMQFGVGLLGCVAGGVVIATMFEKSPIKESSPDQKPPVFPVRIVDKAIGLGKDLTFTSKTLFSRITHRKNYSSQINDQADAGTLCVMLHGLKGHPSIFDDYHDSFEGIKVTYFQPYIHKRGNCPLEEAFSGIYTEILQWSQQNPGKPIDIIGVSNGARGAGHISAKLVSEGQIANHMNVSCIAGPFNGTKIVNHPGWPGFLQSRWNWLFKKLWSEEVHEELSWNSACGKKVVSDMQAAAGGNLHYNFYSTSSDSQIDPFTSAFPEIEGANYFYTSAEGHGSIVRAAKETIVNRPLFHS